MATTWALVELRAGLAQYTSGFHPGRYTERIAVTSSGVNALMLATQLLAGAGDEVVAVVPVWPNLTQQPTMMGARVQRVAITPDAKGVWHLDVQALIGGDHRRPRWCWSIRRTTRPAGP